MPPPPWYASGLQFACTGCGNCCTGGPGYVWISERETARLAEFLKIPAGQVIERYCRQCGDRYSLNEHQNRQGLFDCVFLTHAPASPGDGQTVTHSRRTCSIYPVRPLQCRTWPFWDGNLASPENWQRAAGRCPGMNRGQRHDRATIDALHNAEDWPAST